MAGAETWEGFSRTPRCAGHAHLPLGRGTAGEPVTQARPRRAAAADLGRCRGRKSRNRDLLASMNRRARQQLRLQQTVEGLSVAAVSYYVVGLVAYLVHSYPMLPPWLPPETVIGLSVPLVVLGMWLFSCAASAGTSGKTTGGKNRATTSDRRGSALACKGRQIGEVGDQGRRQGMLQSQWRSSRSARNRALREGRGLLPHWPGSRRGRQVVQDGRSRFRPPGSQSASSTIRPSCNNQSSMLPPTACPRLSRDQNAPA